MLGMLLVEKTISTNDKPVNRVENASTGFESNINI